jgi:hypothetical protein
MLLVVRALLVVACCLAVGDACAEEVVVGRGTSTSRSATDWKGYFHSDMKTLTTTAETTTVFDRAGNPTVTVGGVPFDLAATSPIQSKSIARSVALPQDPEYGKVEIETTSVDAHGVETKVSFVLRDKSMMVPIVVGPLEGAIIRPPAHEQTVAGKTFVVSSQTRTVEVLALIVAPTFEDLLARTKLRDVTEPGTRIEKGTMRVLSASGEAIGFYAGDLRRGDVVQFVAPR